MSAITTSNVTLIEAYDRGTRTGKLVDVAQRVVIALTAQGGTAGDVPASAFGLAEIYEVSNATFDANGAGTYNVQPVGINPDGSELIIGAVATGLRANLTGNLYLTVYGRLAS